MKNLPLIIGVGGHVVAIDPTTGQELWRSKLKGGDIVTMIQKDGKVFAGTKGELFCVDPTTGTILWHNTLKGLGFGLVAFGTDQDVAAGEKVLQQRRQAAAAAAGS